MGTISTLSTVDLTIVAIYFVLIIGTGVFFSKIASKGINEYFLGGRKIPWWILGASGSASNFDMTGTMVITSFFFMLGFQGFWVASRGGLVLCLAVLMAFMGKWLRRSKVLTTAEWMEFRFGMDTGGQFARAVAAIANLVLVTGMVIYFAKGTGLFLSQFLPFSPEICSVGMIVVCLIYTTISGLYGVAYTDVFQEIMILITAGYIIFKVLFLPEHSSVISSAGSEWVRLSPLWVAAPMKWLSNPLMYQMFGLCVMFWVSKSIIEGFGGMPGGYMAQRYYAARDERSAGLMSLEWMLLLTVRWAMVAGIAILGLWLSMKDEGIRTMLNINPEKTLPIVFGKILPTGIKGLAIAGLIAAAMSTFDSTINAGAAYWVKDIYQRYLRPNASQKELVYQGYIAALGIGFIGILLAFGIKNINEIWNWITGPLAAGLFAPLVFRWFWHRFNGYGFAAGTAAGILVAIFTELLFPNMAFYISFPVTICISIVAGVAGSLFTVPVASEVTEKYFLQMRPPGFWNSLMEKFPEEKRKNIVSENRRDFISVFIILIFQMSLFSTAILVVMHEWCVALITGGFLILSGFSLYRVWYRNLPEKSF